MIAPTKIKEHQPEVLKLCSELASAIGGRLGIHDFQRLAEEEIIVLHHRYCLGRTLQETRPFTIGKKSGQPLTLEMVRHRERKGLHKLRWNEYFQSNSLT